MHVSAVFEENMASSTEGMALFQHLMLSIIRFRAYEQTHGSIVMVTAP